VSYLDQLERDVNHEHLDVAHLREMVNQLALLMAQKSAKVYLNTVFYPYRSYTPPTRTNI
jgi:hypothetical protein